MCVFIKHCPKCQKRQWWFIFPTHHQFNGWMKTFLEYILPVYTFAKGSHDYYSVWVTWRHHYEHAIWGHSTEHSCSQKWEHHRSWGCWSQQELAEDHFLLFELDRWEDAWMDRLMNKQKTLLMSTILLLVLPHPTHELNTYFRTNGLCTSTKQAPATTE